MPFRRRAEWLFLLLLVASAFLIRVWGMSRTHFWDEAVYLQNAEVICCGATNYSELDSRPPLLSLVFAAAFLVSHSIYAASVVTAILNALGPLFLYLSGRMIFGRRAAAIAALLFAFAPFFVGVFPDWFASDDTGNSLLSDSPALTLILLGFWLLLRALRKQTHLRFAAAGVALALAVLMRFASLATVGVLGVVAFGARRWWRAALDLALGFALAFAPYLVWSRLRFGGFLTTFRRGWAYFTGPTEPFFYYARNFGVIFSWITLAGLVLWIATHVTPASRRPREFSGEPLTAPSAAANPDPLRSPWMPAFLWFWAATLLIFYSALSHKEARYVMPAAPPLFLLAGSGLATLVQARAKTWRVVGSVVLAAALLYAFLPDRERFESPLVTNSPSDEMQVADFLRQNLPGGTQLYSNFNYPVFAFYSGLPMFRLPESGDALYGRLDALPRDGILIAYKPDVDAVSDPRLDWLDQNPHFRRYREFPTVVLYQYRVDPAAAPSPQQR